MRLQIEYYTSYKNEWIMYINVYKHMPHGSISSSSSWFSISPGRKLRKTGTGLGSLWTKVELQSEAAFFPLTVCFELWWPGMAPW